MSVERSSRLRSIFACQECGHQVAKWHGRCPACGVFGSLVEERAPGEERPAARGQGRLAEGDSTPQLIDAITASPEARLYTGSAELDRVLGGGVVPGMLILVGGDPGIGKSTLVLAACDRLAQQGARCLYVTAEESLAQVKLRAQRLGLQGSTLQVVAETDLDRIEAHVENLAPAVLAVDSIQTVYSAALDSAPGSVAQVREATARLMYLAKGKGVATFVVGHVTKEGTIAGPRMLEHMVDTVLYFEGESGGTYRILRAHKNRFGSTNEIGVFEMRAEGLVEVSNPSAHLLAERPEGAAGSVVVPTVEGTRPLLVEVQGLVASSPFGTPRRTALGIDPNRVALLCAIAERALGVDFVGQDIYVNVAGGVRLSDPAADLGVALALVSSAQRRPVAATTVLIGELGLSGEVRSAPLIELRLGEAAKLGFTDAVLPARQTRGLSIPGLTLHPVRTLEQAREVALEAVHAAPPHDARRQGAERQDRTAPPGELRADMSRGRFKA
ncbi:MAG: DNA repair protein RadA [Pseudomonadota bacterium]